jgi:sulfoquinovosyltransferase
VPESRPHRIALFIEPSPFAYVSGYKNRFQNFINTSGRWAMR